MDGAGLFSYTDYRAFLKELYLQKKSSRAGCSYRKFAEGMGFTASNYLHLVIAGKRNLSHDAIQKIKKNNSWSAQQKKYFENLVLYNQASEEKERQKYFGELEKILGKKRQVLNPDQYAYFSNWYIPVLREILTLKDFEADLGWIVHKLQSKVEKVKIKEALQILARLKMIVKTGKTWVQSEEHLKIPTQHSTDLVELYQKYHQEMLALSKHALDIPSDERDISAMTMSLTRDQFEWLKLRVSEFRDEIQQELQTEEGQGKQDKPELVAQLNMQLFPVTRIKK